MANLLLGFNKFLSSKNLYVHRIVEHKHAEWLELVRDIEDCYAPKVLRPIKSFEVEDSKSKDDIATCYNLKTPLLVHDIKPLVRGAVTETKPVTTGLGLAISDRR